MESPETSGGRMPGRTPTRASGLSGRLDEQHVKLGVRAQDLLDEPHVELGVRERLHQQG